MQLLLSLAWRNLGRNRRRTALTVLTVTAGTALLTLALSMVNGLIFQALARAASAAGHVRVVDPDYARREQLFPLAENLPETAALVAAAEGRPGMVAVTPHIAMGVVAARADRELGESFVLLHGAPAGFYADVLHLGDYLVAGALPATEDEAVVGKDFADQVGAEVGTELTVLGQTQDGSPSPLTLRLSGILDLGSGAQNRQLYVSLDKARWMADIPAGATEILIQLDDHDDGREAAAALRALPAFAGLQVQAWDEREPYATLASFFGAVRMIVASIIVFITGLGVLNTMLMSVLERTAEIGVLRAFGLRTWQTGTLFFVEAVAIAVLGGTVGVALGGTVASLLGHVGINLGEGASKLPASLPIHETIYPNPNPQILATAFLLGLVMALVGGILPALRAAQIQPVEAMRHRR